MQPRNADGTFRRVDTTPVSPSGLSWQTIAQLTIGRFDALSEEDRAWFDEQSSNEIGLYIGIDV